MPILGKSANPSPICLSYANSIPICQSITNSPIHHLSGPSTHLSAPIVKTGPSQIGRTLARIDTDHVNPNTKDNTVNEQGTSLLQFPSYSTKSNTLHWQCIDKSHANWGKSENVCTCNLGTSILYGPTEVSQRSTILPPPGQSNPMPSQEPFAILNQYANPRPNHDQSATNPMPITLKPAIHPKFVLPILDQSSYKLPIQEKSAKAVSWVPDVHRLSHIHKILLETLYWT